MPISLWKGMYPRDIFPPSPEKTINSSNSFFYVTLRSYSSDKNESGQLEMLSGAVISKDKYGIFPYSQPHPKMFDLQRINISDGLSVSHP